jgi:hypothetical protein
MRVCVRAYKYIPVVWLKINKAALSWRMTEILSAVNPTICLHFISDDFYSK